MPIKGWVKSPSTTRKIRRTLGHIPSPFWQRLFRVREQNRSIVWRHTRWASNKARVKRIERKRLLRKKSELEWCPQFVFQTLTQPFMPQRTPVRFSWVTIMLPHYTLITTIIWCRRGEVFCHVTSQGLVDVTTFFFNFFGYRVYLSSINSRPLFGILGLFDIAVTVIEMKLDYDAVRENDRSC